MRTKGWKMPPNAVYVGRPSDFGNPYQIEFGYTREECIQKYEVLLREVLETHPDYLDRLSGKDLVCWCPLDKSCHADVILKILNEKGDLKT